LQAQKKWYGEELIIREISQKLKMVNFKLPIYNNCKIEFYKMTHRYIYVFAASAFRRTKQVEIKAG